MIRVKSLPRQPSHLLVKVKQNAIYRFLIYFVVSMDADLEPGVDYVVIPATFSPNQEVKYWLDIYTEENHICRRLAADYASCEVYILSLFFFSYLFLGRMVWT